MKILIALALCFGLAHAGHHSVVTPDILHHVSKVLSHGYGSHVVLGYPEKAHLVDYGVTVHEEPYYGHHHDHYSGHHGHVAVAHVGHYGHGHGHHSHGHGHGHGHGHYGGYGHKHHYHVPAYLGYAGTGHGHYHGHGHGHY